MPVINVDGAMSTRREHSTTALTFLYFDPSLTFERRVAVAQEVARTGANADDAAIGVTGVVPARVEQSQAILDSLPAITAGTLLLILLVVGIWQRSVLAPVVTLVAAGSAYVVAIGIVAWFGRATGQVLAQEVEPLILVLVLGIVTDYCVFLLARTRRGIAEGLATAPGGPPRHGRHGPDDPDRRADRGGRDGEPRAGHARLLPGARSRRWPWPLRSEARGAHAGAGAARDRSRGIVFRRVEPEPEPAEPVGDAVATPGAACADGPEPARRAAAGAAVRRPGSASPRTTSARRGSASR